jgi:hypothetical protein
MGAGGLAYRADYVRGGATGARAPRSGSLPRGACQGGETSLEGVELGCMGVRVTLRDGVILLIGLERGRGGSLEATGLSE